MLKNSQILGTIAALGIGVNALPSPALAQDSALATALKRIAALERENAQLKIQGHRSASRESDKHTRNSPITNANHTSAQFQQYDEPPLTNWGGFYSGLNAGYGWGTSNGTPATGYPVASLSVEGVNQAPFAPMSGVMASNSGYANIAQAGFIGGAQVGYNYQLNNYILIGAETDIQGTNIRGNGSYTGAAQLGYLVAGGDPGSISSIGSGNITAGIDWLGTVRGRIGYLIKPSLLLFATGGLAYAGTSTSFNTAGNFSINVDGLNFPFLGSGYGSFTTNQSNIRTGWNIGGGAEWMLANNWSLKAEAIYYDLGNQNISTAAFINTPIIGTFNVNAALFSTANVSYAGVVARAGVNYHFNMSNIEAINASKIE